MPKIPAKRPTASKIGLGIMAKTKIIIVSYALNRFSKTVNQVFFLRLYSARCLPECPKKNETISPNEAPNEATSATKSGEYMEPPAITVKNAGPETKNVALETKLIKKMPKSPKLTASLNKSLKIKSPKDSKTENVSTKMEKYFLLI